MRLAIELLLLFVLGAGMLTAAIVATLQIPDEKVRYFVLGYYVAIHHDLVHRIWGHLRPKQDPAQDT